MIEQGDQRPQPKLLAPREYPAGGTTVQISAREFPPFIEKDNRSEALVLFLGWGPNEKAPSYEELANSLADSFGRRVLLVNTRPEGLIENSLFHEAEATYQFLKDMGINDVIVAGYSQGGAKAVNLAVISQESSTINPEALILLAPVGLNSQTPGHLLAAFALDTVGQTMLRISTEKVVGKSKGERNRVGKVRQSLRSAIDLVSGATGEVVRSKTEYPKRLAHEIREMVQQNPRLEEIKIPIILIQGKHDKPVGPKDDLNRGQMAKQDEEGAVKKALQALFPNSPYINRVLAERTSNHALVLLRSPQIARVASYLLERRKR